MPLTDPNTAAANLSRIAQALLSTKMAYSNLGAVLIGNPPTHQQLDEWQQQLAECTAAWDSALEITHDLRKDVRAIVDRAPVDDGGRW